MRALHAIAAGRPDYDLRHLNDDEGAPMVWQRRAVLACATALAAGCTGMADTRQAPPPGHAALTQLAIVVDTDTIGAAFAAYQSAVPFGAKSGDWQGFIDHLSASLREQARGAGIDATVDVVSMRALRVVPPSMSRGRPVLFVRALTFTRRVETVSGRDHGWGGDTAWEFALSEKQGSGPYARAWVAGVKNENLNPALCGDYSRCSAALAGRVFDQMRKDGLAR